MCLVVLMLFFSDSSDEQELGFSACYNKLARNIYWKLKFQIITANAFDFQLNQAVIPMQWFSRMPNMTAGTQKQRPVT